MLWIIVIIVAWFALGYIGAHLALTYDRTMPTGLAFFSVITGPIVLGMGLAMLFHDRGVDGDKIIERFFNVKERK